ncbi:MAG TPA: PPC domain-containing protein, partial [Blastocatellia bacterium]|nr:PPC domain-containing protein [Blastocatellia bacterium]
RETPAADLDRAAAFSRLKSNASTTVKSAPRKTRRLKKDRASVMATARIAAALPSIQSFGTGDGDIFEIEPNDTVSQGVALPVNVFGTIRVLNDVDFFAFEAFEGVPVVIEPFAVRLPRSNLIPDIALFNAAGQVLARDVGDEDFDPIIRYTPQANQTLIVGISDADDLGGFDFDYILNITMGIDVDENEPNDATAQQLTEIPSTVFGQIDVRSDVDFFSFTAEAGQTLIVDVDAEVLGSRLDAEINLLDPQTGIEYFYNDQKDGDDPRFNIVLPYTGRYVIGIGAFSNDSRGFYRLNASLVSGSGAPRVDTAIKLSKKLVEITGSGFGPGTTVEVNGVERATTVLNSGTVRAKVKARAGNIITVINPPDDRRSNPLILR